MSLSSDPRVTWLANKACQGLGVSEDLFSTAVEDEAVKSSLSSFLDGGKFPPQCITVLKVMRQATDYHS